MPDAQPELDRVVRLAAALFDTPIAWLMLREGAQVRCAASLGPSSPATDGLAWIGAIEQPSFVLDATNDARFVDPRSVRDELGLRFFAGVPLRSRTGAPLGSLCALDTRPRTGLRSDLLPRLGDLASLAVEALERARPGSALAAAVVHELNNPLAFVLSNLGFVREELHGLESSVEPGLRPGVSGIRQALEEVAEGAERLRAIVQALSAFAHDGDRAGLERELLAIAESRRAQ